MSKNHGRTFRNLVAPELDTLPLMGLFVVLIPMLLLSAVFLEISVIDMGLPNDDPPAAADKDRFGVSVRILDQAFVVEAKGQGRRLITGKGEESLVLLSEALDAVTAGHPDHHAVTIISEPQTRYEEIILVMDLTREAGLSQVSLMGADS